MKIEILLVALTLSFSQASYDVNRTVYPLGHPNNGKSPVNPGDPVQLYHWEHTLMMFFTPLQTYYTGNQANEIFLDCLEDNIELYSNFSKIFAKNITGVGYSVETSSITQKKPKGRIINALSQIVTLSDKFGKEVELAAVEENSQKAREVIKKYKIKITKEEYTLVKAMNRLAKQNYKNEIKKIDDRLKEINLQVQVEANKFLGKIVQCVRK